MERKKDVWLKEAYTKYFDSLISYVRRFVVSSHAAEDLAHDAFLRVYTSENFDEIRKPQNYLFRTARNIALDGNSRHCVAKTDSAAEVADIVDERVSVEREAMTAQEYATIRAAMSRLPERRQQVLVLSAFFEYSGQEIADHLNISRATVHRELGRAIEAVNAAKSLLESEKVRNRAQVIALERDGDGSA